VPGTFLGKQFNVELAIQGDVERVTQQRLALFCNKYDLKYVLEII
jgi:hypothetical protein